MKAQTAFAWTFIAPLVHFDWWDCSIGRCPSWSTWFGLLPPCPPYQREPALVADLDVGTSERIDLAVTLAIESCGVQ